MINRNTITLGLCGLAVVTLVSGCVVGGYSGVAVEAPPTTVIMYPDYYVWDGYEYVGVIGNRYYYLGPRQVWVPCEPFRLERFHRWERVHPDWRSHAIPNRRYRPASQEKGHGRAPGRDRGRHDRR